MLGRQPHIYRTWLIASFGNHPVETNRSGNPEQKIVIKWDNYCVWRFGILVKQPKLLP
jgi:hypothetical protein